MSSIFENRIYKQGDDVKGGVTEEGTVGWKEEKEQGSDQQIDKVVGKEGKSANKNFSIFAIENQ